MRRHRRSTYFTNNRPSWPFAVNQDSAQAQGLVMWLPLGYRGTSDEYDIAGDRYFTDTGGMFHVTDQSMRFARGSSSGTRYLLYNAGLLLDEPITMTCWYNSTSSTQDQTLISLGNNGTNGMWRISLGGNVVGDPIRCTKQADSASAQSESLSATGYSLNTWQMAGGVFVSDMSRTAYLNGVAGTEDTTSRGDPTPDFTAIGMLKRATTVTPIIGSLADARIYSVAKSADEMARMYDPKTRWDLYYPLRRKSWSFPKVTATPPSSITYTQLERGVRGLARGLSLGSFR